MAYTEQNFKTKKALKDALNRGEKVYVFQPGLGSVPKDGPVALEGPHYPKPQTWYGVGQMRDGKLVSIK